MSETTPPEALSDEALLSRLSVLTHQARRVEADLVSHIGEVDARRLYAAEGSPSMFEYCVRVLRLRENEAYLRITVARAARAHPLLLPMLRDGRLHLSGIARLARHLTPDNRDTILKRAAGMSHRQVKELCAELAPMPDVPATIRRLPAASARTRPAEPPRLCAHRVESASQTQQPAATSPGPATPSHPLPPASPPLLEPIAPRGTGSSSRRARSCARSWSVSAN